MRFLKGKRWWYLIGMQMWNIDMGEETFGEWDILGDIVVRNEKVITEYIKKQLKEDDVADQISWKEYIDPFTNNKEK